VRAGTPQTPWTFDKELLAPISTGSPVAGDRVQALSRLADVGIKTVINGPFTFAPDGNPLVGPVPGVRNCWMACAVMVSLSLGGGVGLASRWMVDGDPGEDIWAMDVARFGDWASSPTPMPSAQATTAGSVSPSPTRSSR
jgi:dimethylglycine dehydrogenase